MKKQLFCILCLLLCPALALAAVPDERIHEAVLTLTWPDANGECWVEGHVVLGEEVKGDTTEVYLYTCYQNYGFVDGVFTDCGGGSIGPRTLIFDHTAEGYALLDIVRPEDGTEYVPSIRRMMPESCIQKMNQDSGAIRAEMVRQMHEQAQAYLDSIGRTEPVQDWRERDLQLSGMFIPASNFMSNVDQNYPLWVTSLERVEDGVRYVYTREWIPEADTPDGQTGTERLTKTRYDDGCVVETITANVQTDSLIMTLADAGGSITYTFAYDGQNDQRPEIAFTGACGVDLQGIAVDISRLQEP